jgi:hypothetical protein
MNIGKIKKEDICYLTAMSTKASPCLTNVIILKEVLHKQAD